MNCERNKKIFLNNFSSHKQINSKNKKKVNRIVYKQERYFLNTFTMNILSWY